MLARVCNPARKSDPRVPGRTLWYPRSSGPPDCSTSFGAAMRMGTSASYLHAFVIFFYAALLVNILYPTFLLRMPSASRRKGTTA